jgi:hypothetical protein
LLKAYFAVHNQAGCYEVYEVVHLFLLFPIPAAGDPIAGTGKA